MRFYLGCAVWSYKGWVGEFYPPKSPARDFLRLYSQRFTAVEGNTTFYATPAQDTIARWVEQTPPQFKFCLKFPQEVTHQGLLTEKLPQALAFIQRVRGLGDRLGPIFAQLPPTYTPDYLEDLTQFLQILSQENLPLAVEVRHPDWFTPTCEQQLNQRLEQLQVGRVLLDTRPIYDPKAPPVSQSRRKPPLPVHPCLTADFTLIRFISHPEADYNVSYIQQWIQYVEHCLQKNTKVYFFVHCPVEERSPFTAHYFQQQLEQYGVKVPPLPWDNPPDFPQQLSLF